MFNTQLIKSSDILELERALRSLVRGRYPGIAVEQGSSLNDLIITSLSYVAAAIRSESQEVRRRLYLADLVNSDTADSFTLLQDLASNFLVSTEEAPPKRGLITFRFSNDVVRTIPADITMSRGDNTTLVKLFDSTQDTVLTADSYIPVTEDSIVYYEYSVLAEAVRSSDDTSIFPGTFSTSSPLNDLVSVVNRSPFVGLSSDQFNRKSLIGRIEHAQTLRTFTTRSGVEATLLSEAVPNVLRILGVGAGDPEMQRDSLPESLTGSRFHALGMSNIVVASRITETPVQVPGSGTVGSYPVVGVKHALRGSTYLPLVSDFGTSRYTKVLDPLTGRTSIESTEIESGQSLDTGTVSLSLGDESQIYLNGSSANNKFTINQLAGDLPATQLAVYVDNNMPVIEGLIGSEEYNTLASSVEPVAANLVQVLVPDLEVGLRPNLTVNLDATSIKRTLIDLINDWDEAFPISVGSMLSRLNFVYAGAAQYFDFKEEVTYVLYLPDGRFIGMKTSERLGVEDESKQLGAYKFSYAENLLPMQISNRTLNYQASIDDIQVTIVDV